MTLALVDQLYFARASWRDGLQDLSHKDAEARVEPMNAISWMVGHLAAHEQTLWLKIAQGRAVDTAVDLCKPGQPAVTPPFDAMLAAWEQIIAETNPFLDALKPDDLTGYLTTEGEPMRESTGTMLQRLIYHYWYHLGEMQAVRQILGHTDLPAYVGHMPETARYRTDQISRT